jgi:preprotein translocase subunit YajC
MCKRIVPLAAWSAFVIGCFVLAGDALAQDGGQVFSTPPVTAEQQPSFMQSLISMLPMLAICYLIFYFMVIKPQETKTKKHAALVTSLKRGDSVVTSSGIVGKVAGIEKDHVMLEIAQNVKVKVLLSHVTRLESESQAA